MSLMLLKKLPNCLQKIFNKNKPKASEVLTSYLQQSKEPPWTAYFVKYSSVKNDQWGMSSFNWKVGNSNYHILRTGCFPFIRYHCTKQPQKNLFREDVFYRFLKRPECPFSGVPCLAYGLISKILISHSEIVHTSHGPIEIYFFIPENKGSKY